MKPFVITLFLATCLFAARAQEQTKQDSQPSLLHSVPPEFSDEARADKIGGTVIVRVRIEATGGVSKVVVVRGIGHGLDEKAVEAVRQYQFRPAKKDGMPVASEIIIQVNFQIIDKEGTKHT